MTPNITSELTSGAARTRPQRKLKVGVGHEKMTARDATLPLVTPLRAVLIAMLAWALLPSNPYGYYIFLRWVACGIFVYLSVAAHRSKEPAWLLFFVVNAGLYNPVLRAHLGRPIWSVVNLVSICLLAASFRCRNLSKGESDA